MAQKVSTSVGGRTGYTFQAWDERLLCALVSDGDEGGDLVHNGRVYHILQYVDRGWGDGCCKAGERECDIHSYEEYANASLNVSVRVGTGEAALFPISPYGCAATQPEDIDDLRKVLRIPVPETLSDPPTTLEIITTLDGR